MFVKENLDRKEKKIVLTGIEDMECPGVYQRKSMWKFQGFIKNEVEFPRVTKEI